MSVGNSWPPHMQAYPNKAPPLDFANCVFSVLHACCMVHGHSSNSHFTLYAYPANSLLTTPVNMVSRAAMIGALLCWGPTPGHKARDCQHAQLLLTSQCSQHVGQAVVDLSHTRPGQRAEAEAVFHQGPCTAVQQPGGTLPELRPCLTGGRG